jgi:hypothetical protein
MNQSKLTLGASVVDPDSDSDPDPHLVFVSRLDSKADPGREKYSQKYMILKFSFEGWR